MPSSADTVHGLGAAAGVIRSALQRVPDALILIDGRSGAGKSTLAEQLRDDVAGSVLALDAVYPGWDGLRVGADAVIDDVLLPRAAGLPGRWAAWNWSTSTPGATHTIPSIGPLLVEGCGILTPRSAAVATVAVWIEAPSDLRRDRALARDGDTYRPHWERWARQEDAHLEANRPSERATLRVEVD